MKSYLHQIEVWNPLATVYYVGLLFRILSFARKEGLVMLETTTITQITENIKIMKSSWTIEKSNTKKKLFSIFRTYNEDNTFLFLLFPLFLKNELKKQDLWIKNVKTIPLICLSLTCNSTFTRHQKIQKHPQRMKRKKKENDPTNKTNITFQH